MGNQASTSNVKYYNTKNPKFSCNKDLTTPVLYGKPGDFYVAENETYNDGFGLSTGYKIRGGGICKTTTDLALTGGGGARDGWTKA